jgi:hypothetical protein
MLYRELVEFEPLDTIIQLREAAEASEARRLVKTYAFSDRMVEQLTGLVFPQLQTVRGVDNKGIFIVGNYGTGKSHLMAVIAALAERADLMAEVKNERIRTEAATFAGCYKVLRMELGAVTRRLYYIVTDQISAFLQDEGIDYTFPRLEEVGENKSGLLEAMRLFNAKYPDHGLLLVVDEVLDYLRAQDAAGLNLDFGFLRELGEVTELAPFRFIAGVQESLFDSPSFAFFAQAVQRVRARFEQVRIAREDVAYVVQQRLLAKSDVQVAWITEHLRKFAVLYPAMADRLTEYARLFPIHPAYIEAFEQVYIAEKREVLKTLTAAIRTVLDTPVPTAETGLISYDHYWHVILDDPSLRSQAGVISVVEKGTTIRNRVEGGYTRPALEAMALRIVNALCVQRLTTTDVRAPIGITAEELRDDLCLWTALPAESRNGSLLLDQVKTALREIMRTVSGQFITYNKDNGQYYIDPDKDVDVEAKIEERADLVSAEQMTQFYYDALRQLFRGLPQSVYVPGYQIWSYELPWTEHKVTRPGYLFFGPPNKRSTAQPPRDFYIYFLSPFVEGPQAALAPTQDDEVVFTLSGMDQELRAGVRRFAAARLLSLESTDLAAQYAAKADEHVRKVRQWLERNLNARLRIHYRGSARTVPEVLAAMRSTASQDVEEMVRLMAAHMLEARFAEAYPDYPRFARLQTPVSEQGRGAAAMDAVRFIARGARTQLGYGIVDGLGLVDSSEVLRPLNSPYARHLFDLLEGRETLQVVNAGEVIVQVAGGATPLWKERRFQLEPEWVAVLLVALVADGRIELNLGGNHPVLDAASVEAAYSIALADLGNFRFYKRPRGVPVARWQQIFEGLGLQAALIRDENTRREALRQLAERVQRDLERVTIVIGKIENGLALWGESLYTDRIRFNTRDGAVEGHSHLGSMRLSQTDLLPDLRAARQFLEKLSRYNAPGKLQNLDLTEAQIVEGLAACRKSLRTGEFVDLVAQFQPLAAYLETAAANLREDDPWLGAAGQARAELVDVLRGYAQNGAPLATSTWRQRLEQLKRAYVDRYSELHRTYVLDQAGEGDRQQLLTGPRAAQLKRLAGIDLFGPNELNSWRAAVTAVPACAGYHPGVIADAPTCPACRFRAAAAGAHGAGERVALLDRRLDALLAQWHSALRSELAKAGAQAAIANMTAAERRPIEQYLALGDPAAAALPHLFVESANQALRGLRAVKLDGEAILAALRNPGMPCTVDELESRFRAYVLELLGQGNDRTSTRLTIE